MRRRVKDRPVHPRLESVAYLQRILGRIVPACRNSGVRIGSSWAARKQGPVAGLVLAFVPNLS